MRGLQHLKRNGPRVGPGLLWSVLLLGGLGCGQNYSRKPVDQALVERNLRPVGPARAPAARADTSSTLRNAIDLGGLRASLPEGWRSVAPASAMRQAEFRMPGPAGSDEAVLAVFRFPPGQGGGVEANVERWIAQFHSPQGGAAADVTRGERWVNGMHVTRVSIFGTYADQDMSKVGPKVDFGMLGAVVEAPSGLYFFKLVGPGNTVQRWVGAFEAFVSSLVPE